MYEFALEHFTTKQKAIRYVEDRIWNDLSAKGENRYHVLAKAKTRAKEIIEEMWNEQSLKQKLKKKIKQLKQRLFRGYLSKRYIDLN